MQHSNMRLAPKGSKAVPEIQEARKQQEAKERLEAAAPDLLFALEQLVSMAVVWETVDHRKNIQLENSEAYQRARAAIAKATGEK